MKNKLMLLVAILPFVAACAIEPTNQASQTFTFVAGTAPGDPCKIENTMIDTPRGYPRVCVKRKWVPLCSESAATTPEACKSAE